MLFINFLGGYMCKKGIVMFMTVVILLNTIFPQNANAYSFRDIIKNISSIARALFNNRGLLHTHNNHEQQEEQRILQHNTDGILNVDINNVDNQGTININSNNNFKLNH